jgi:hypothetical protein
VIHLASVSAISYAESNGGIFILIGYCAITVIGIYTNTISYFTLSTLQFTITRTVVHKFHIDMTPICFSESSYLLKLRCAA